MNNVLYQVGYLQRMPLGTTYPNVVSYVAQLLSRFPGATLTIDATGCGKPVADMFVFSGVNPRLVMITGGATETRNGNVSYVPKLVLISQLQALLHAGRLRILRQLPEAETLVRELQDFRVQYSDAGSMMFNARSGRHDDLVLALSLAVWAAEGGGMASHGIFDLYRQRAGGAPTTMHIGLDIGQSRDPTAVAIVRKVANPTAADLVSMPLAEPPQKVYQPGSVEWAAAQARKAG
jgi:hypothetical protein